METRTFSVDYLRTLGFPLKCEGGKLIERILLDKEGKDKIYDLVVRLPKKDDKKRPKDEAWIINCTVKVLDDCDIVYPDPKETKIIGYLARKNERGKFVITDL